MHLPVSDNDQSSGGVNIAVASCHCLPVTLLLSDDGRIDVITHTLYSWSPGDVGLGLVTHYIVAEGVRHGRAIAAIITGHRPAPGAHRPGHHAPPGGRVGAAVEHIQQVPAALCLPAATVILKIIKFNDCWG